MFSIIFILLLLELAIMSFCIYFQLYPNTNQFSNIINLVFISLFLSFVVFLVDIYNNQNISPFLKMLFVSKMIILSFFIYKYNLFKPNNNNYLLNDQLFFNKIIFLLSLLNTVLIVSIYYSTVKCENDKYCEFASPFINKKFYSESFKLDSDTESDMNKPEITKDYTFFH